MSPADSQALPGSPDEWLTSAQSDLRLANIGRDDPGVLAAQVCFHAQQAAEKALKAFQRSREVRFPLTHDLEQLLEVVSQA